MLKDAASGLLAVAGAAAIIHADDAVTIAALTFLLAATLSCLRPQLSSLWPILCGGAVGVAQAWSYVTAPHADAVPFLSAMLATGLAFAIGTAGAGAGRNLSVFDFG